MSTPVSSPLDIDAGTTTSLMSAGRTRGWQLYDTLLAEVPDDHVVARYLHGQEWTVLESAGPWSQGMGLAMAFPRPDCRRERLRDSLAGQSLRQVAEGLRSWDFSLASLGMAAVNSHLNHRERLEERLGRSLAGPVTESVFTTMAEEITGRKVAVVGHFPQVENLSQRCDLTILERTPQPGDLPDSACEYVLPEQDYVFITGTTLINKTLPRLLELAERAKVVLVGPSVSFTPIWFDLGVDVLAGSVVVDPDLCWTTACEGGSHEIWTSSTVRLQVRAEDF